MMTEPCDVTSKVHLLLSLVLSVCSPIFNPYRLNKGVNMKRLLHIYFIVGLFMLQGIAFTADNEPINDPNLFIPTFSIIEPNTAILAASEYLPCYYPGSWEYFEYEVAYDLDGNPAAYIIIFRDPNAVIKTVDELRISVNDQHQEIKNIELQVEQLKQLKNLDETSKQNIESPLRKSINAHKRAAYHTDSFATVITGALDDSPIVYRCYRGLPGNFVREEKTKEWLQKNYPDKKLHIQRLIFLSPVDIRYEVTPSEKLLRKKEGVEMPTQVEIAEQAKLLTFSKDEAEIEEIAIEKQKRRAKEEIKAQQSQQMPEEYRKKMEEGKLSRRLHNASNWKQYQEQRLNQSTDTK